jgi:hypothetical protein
MKKAFIPAVLLVFLFSGCVQTIAVNTMGGIINTGFSAFMEESDLQYAEKALPGNLKLLEVMLKSAPDNQDFLKLASEGYSSYALGFLEDTEPERAREFYRRGRDYGFRMLKHEADMAKAIEGSPEDLKSVLATKGTDEVPGAFWTGFGWGSYIYLSLTNTDAIADLPRAEAMMQFVEKKDSSFYFAGADVFLGTLYGSRPKIFGGDPEKSKAYFEKAIRLNGGKFLMTYVYYAKSYAVQIQDEQLFVELLKKVEEASLDASPEIRLPNAIAKQKAKLLMAKKESLF